MIPYAIFMMNFIWKDASLEVRALDPVDNGVSFRVDRKWAVKLFLEGRPDRIDCLFLENEKRTYRRVVLTDFVIAECLREVTGEPHNGASVDCDFATFTLTSVQPDFKEALAKLLKDYTQYIWRKLSVDERSAMEEMTGIEVGEAYPSSLAEWQEMVRENFEENSEEISGKRETYTLKSVELAICLEQPKLRSAFLAKSKEEFFAYYWKENGLTGHPITRQKVTHIYIGNNFCPLLFPELEELEKIVAKAEESDLIPVYVFSTMPEHLAEEYTARMEWILNHDSKTAPAELVINDLGTALLLKHPAEKGSGRDCPIRLTLGPLATKRKKDPRMAWRVNWESDEKANFETSVDGNLYREYLKNRFGIERVSYEACGYPIKITGKGNALHLPLYQTNTSGYCTLYALCKKGDREAQEEVRNCPHYCEENYVFYPKPMPLIGRFNSLFGCSMRELNDSRILNDYIDAGISRLVVRM